MAYAFVLPIRIAQAILAVIILGLTAYIANAYDQPGYFYGGGARSPDTVNFIIFNSVWTLLVLCYLIFIPRFSPNMHHPYAVLAVEVVTTIFWFSGFIALAVFTSDYLYCNVNICSASKAASVFSAFEFVLWAITTFLIVRDVLATRNKRGGPVVSNGHGPQVVV